MPHIPDIKWSSGFAKEVIQFGYDFYKITMKFSGQSFEDVEAGMGPLLGHYAEYSGNAMLFIKYTIMSNDTIALYVDSQSNVDDFVSILQNELLITPEKIYWIRPGAWGN